MNIHAGAHMMSQSRTDLAHKWRQEGSGRAHGSPGAHQGTMGVSNYTERCI